MLVVLMAIIDLGRMKVHAVTRWLWLALSGGMFVAAPAGCEKDCNCRCECGQPPPALTAPMDSADAAAGSATGRDVTHAATDGGPAAGDAKAGLADAAVDASVKADPGSATTPKEAVTPKKPRRKPAEPAKEPEKVVVPDIPQVAYGPPPVLDPGREIQPLYGVPFNPDTTPQLMYGPPANRDKLESK